MAQWNQGPQFGDERRLRLQDLMVRLRMAFSEPHAGSLGTVVYDVDKDFSADVRDFDLSGVPEPDKYAVNELAVMLNDAQVYTVMDLYERGYAFPEAEHRIPVYRDMRTAVLPGDFMAIESLFHHASTDRRQVDASSIKELEDSYRYGTSYSSREFFCYYEVRGNAGKEIVRGQLLRENVLDADDMLQLPTEAEARLVSIGDYVTNETDGSAAKVTAITGRTLILNELIGGRTDTFEALDFYSVQSAAQPFECLHLWPAQKSVGEKTVHQGAASRWTVNEWVSPTRLCFSLDTIPESLHPRKSRIYVAVQYDTTPDAAMPTFKRIAGGGLTSELKTDFNEVELLSEDDFQPGALFYVSVMTNDYDPVTGTGHALTPSRVEVYEADADNYLKLQYTRLPIPMLRPEDLCELPPFLIPCVIAYAKVLGYQKKSGMPRVDPNMLSEYEMFVDKGVKFLRKRGPSGPSNVFRNPANRSLNRRYGGNYIPLGWTNRVYF